jgi:hypothetical protein
MADCVWNSLFPGEIAMNGEVDSGEKQIVVDDDVAVSELSEDTIVLDDITDIDNVGDISVEINVEELVAKIEAGEGDAEEHRKEIRRRLDEIEEARKVEEELGSTYNFNLDDEL